MKTLTVFFVLLVAVLLSGCYTQFAVTRNEPEAVVDSEQVGIVEPPPTVIIVEPVIYPDPPSYYTPPLVGVTSPGPVVQKPQESPKREIGNTRPATGSGTSSDTNTRPIGQDRKPR